MRVLVICQYYYPEPFRISDICEELVRRGHVVKVITGIPNYPMGAIYKEYKNKKHRDEILNGVMVHRCYTIGRRSGILFRIMNYCSYAISSTIYVSAMSDLYDVVFVYQLSPVTMACSGIKYKNKYGKRMVLYCLDLWPESLFSKGIKQNSILYLLIRWISGKIYKSADTILVTSKSFKEHLISTQNIAPTKIEYLPQYAEEVFCPAECHKKPDAYLDLLFAGNIGVAQNVEVIIRAANELKDDKSIRWHIVGDGSELNRCKGLTAEMNLDTIHFYGREPLSEMPKYYAKADAMIVTLIADDILSLTLPGKIQTYLASGKPVIGAINGETNELINRIGAGICVPAQDHVALAEAVMKLRKSSTDYGANGYEYYKRFMTKERSVDRLETILCELCEHI